MDLLLIQMFTLLRLSVEFLIPTTLVFNAALLLKKKKTSTTTFIQGLEVAANVDFININ